MPTWQARLAASYSRAVIRKRDWGEGVDIALRARRVFGLPSVYARLATRGLRIERVQTAENVQGEWVQQLAPSRGVIMYMHGGAYLACSAASHRPITAALARATGCRVFAVDYRLAPEMPFPCAYNDVVSAYEWLTSSAAPGEPVVIAGDSAGGGLALSLAARIRDEGWPAPACVVALSPVTDLSLSSASLISNDGRCAMFRTENMKAFAEAYLAGASPTDPRGSPLAADLHALPPVLMQASTTELLLDDARRMHERITSAGGVSRLTEYNDVVHAWQLMALIVPEASDAIDEVAGFIKKSLPPQYPGTA